MATDSDFQNVTGVFSADEINKNRQLIKKYRILTDGRPGWEQTENGTSPPPWIEPSAGGIQYQNWKLEPVPDSSGEVTLKLGTISNFGYASSSIDATNPDEVFTPGFGDVISLKFSAIFPTEFEVVINNEGWDGYPNQYGFDGEGGFESYHYPIWYFTDIAPGQKIAEGVYGVRVVSDSNFSVIAGIWEGLPTTSGATVPVLVESFKALPEEFEPTPT
jgi:hypothetical protein